MLKFVNICILNGKLGERSSYCMILNSSVVDYAISNVNVVLCNTHEFTVLDNRPMLSVVHL